MQKTAIATHHYTLLQKEVLRVSNRTYKFTTNKFICNPFNVLCVRKDLKKSLNR